MKDFPVLEEKYGTKVWTNKNTDNMRREECLCLHCSKMTYDKTTNCSIAQDFYELCIKSDLAFIMTRCKQFIVK